MMFCLDDSGSKVTKTMGQPYRRRLEVVPGNSNLNLYSRPAFSQCKFAGVLPDI